MTDPLIVEFASVGAASFDTVGFLVGVAQAAIGSFLGFAFGIATLRIQKRSDDKDAKRAENERMLDTLQRVLICSRVNLETLGLFKAGQIAALRPEVPVMRAAYEAAFADENKLGDLLAASSNTVHFYSGMPEISKMEAPSFSDLASANKHMPALSVFVYRASSFIDEMNARIFSRNELISQHAKENSGDGMTKERLLFFSAMLCDESAAIIELDEFAMAFLDLAGEQIETYLEKIAKVAPLAPPMLPQTSAMLPPKDTFPAMRALLRVF